MNMIKAVLAVFLTLGIGLAQAAEQVTYYHNNLVGSPIAATDDTGALVWEQTYDAWGVPLLPTSDSRSFTGAPLDTATDLVDMQARWYSPHIGRMLALDPPGFREDSIQSFNLYAYGNNNPYRYVDPDGEIIVAAIFIVGAAWTAYDTYQAYQDGGAAAAAKTLAVDGAITLAGGAVGKGAKLAYTGWKARGVVKGAASAVERSDDVIYVTKDGVALVANPKYKIPDSYVQNPHRNGSYGEIVNGKFRERLRIDPATPQGQKGPNHSHYHKDGKGEHYSPREGDQDPGF